MTNQPTESGNNKTLTIIIFGGLLVVYILLAFLLRMNLPETGKLIDIVSSIYKQFGYPLVFGAALGEATFPIGMYFPGSTIVMLGFALAKTGEFQVLGVYLSAVAACMSGYSINYVLGKYGWLKFLRVLGLEKGIEDAKEKLEKNEQKAFAFGYMSATTGAFLSSAAGVMNIPFRRFFISSLLSQSVWSALWGSIAFLFGYTFVEIFLKYLIFIIWGGVVLYLMKVYLFKK